MPRRSRPTPPSRSIRKEDFPDRDSEGVLFVPKAGEMLFHLKKQPKWSGGV